MNTMKTLKGRPLEKWLLTNALFSTGSALVMICFNARLAGVLGIRDDAMLPSIGIGLLLFAGFIGWVLLRSVRTKQLIYLISSMDFAWVLGSMSFLFAPPSGLTTTGYWTIAIVALIVGVFGLQQWRNAPN